MITKIQLSGSFEPQRRKNKVTVIQISKMTETLNFSEQMLQTLSSTQWVLKSNIMVLFFSANNI